MGRKANYMKPAIFLLVVAGALFLSSPAVETQNLFGILRYMLTPHYYTHHHHHRHFHHHHGILSATLLWDQNFPLYGNWQMLADDAHTSNEICDQETSEFKFGFAHQNSGYVIPHGGHHQDWGEYKPMALKQIPHGWAITFAGT